MAGRLVAASVMVMVLAAGCGAEQGKDGSDDSTVEAMRVDRLEQAQAKAKAKKPASQPATSVPLRLRSLTYNGNGCPAGSVAPVMSSDQKAFTLIFSQFVAVVNPGQKAPQTTRRCNVNVGLDLPQGWQAALITLDQRGYAEIPAGGQAKIDTTAAFQGGAGKKYSTVLRGPFADAFHARQEVPFKNLTWSKCSGAATLKLTVDATVKTKAKAGAYLGIDTFDGELHSQVGVATRKCK